MCCSAMMMHTTQGRRKIHKLGCSTVVECKTNLFPLWLHFLLQQPQWCHCKGLLPGRVSPGNLSAFFSALYWLPHRPQLASYCRLSTKLYTRRQNIFFVKMIHTASSNLGSDKVYSAHDSAEVCVNTRWLWKACKHQWMDSVLIFPGLERLWGLHEADTSLKLLWTNVSRNLYICRAIGGKLTGVKRS